MNESVQHNLSVWSLVLDAGIVVQIVLLLLLLLSFLSWAIIFNKWRVFRLSAKDDAAFSTIFWGGTDMQQVLQQSKELKHSPQSMMFQKAFAEYFRLRKHAPEAEASLASKGGMLSVRHAIDSEWSKQMDLYGQHLSFLATVGSTAPFIGLFGTVWGIIDAFQSIAISQNTSLATVAPGIAEALVATAFGLLAAIPAVIAYNSFSGNMKALDSKLDAFADEFINLLTRHVRK